MSWKVTVSIETPHGVYAKDLAVSEKLLSNTLYMGDAIQDMAAAGVSAVFTEVYRMAYNATGEEAK